jgi:phosphoribosylamine--glycine ligase
MFTPTGPKVLEYNVRFGDPETQVVLPRMVDDLGDLLAAAAAGGLPDHLPVFDDGAAVTVVCASAGYPAAPRTGDPVEGLENASAVDGVTIFAAGVGEHDGRLVTAGGRVLAVTGQGSDVADARRRAYAAVAELSWPGMQVRGDVAASPTAVV